MARKISTGVGSVSGVKAAEKNAPADSTIRSEPENFEIAERDSGDENDPSTTGPVDGDGNVMESEDVSNQTVASDNPTNAEVAEQKELLNGLGDTGEPNPNTRPDLFDGSTPKVDEAEFNELLNADLDPEEEDVQLSDEEIARADAELKAEKVEDWNAERTGEDTKDEPHEPRDDDDSLKPDGDATPAPVVNPRDDEQADDEKQDEPVGLTGRENFDLDQEATTAPVTKHVVGNDGQIEDVSDELSEDDTDDSVLAPAHNGEGHRNTFINSKGDITVMDDETAERFYSDPKFYEYTYDAATAKNMHVSMLRWANGRGEAVGGLVGDSYELDK